MLRKQQGYISGERELNNPGRWFEDEKSWQNHAMSRQYIKSPYRADLKNVMKIESGDLLCIKNRETVSYLRNNFSFLE